MNRMKRKTTQMTRGVKKRHHTVKSYCIITNNYINKFSEILGKDNVVIYSKVNKCFIW